MESFTTNPKEAAIVCGEIAEQGKPILLAIRDEVDGGWQFLCGAVDTEDPSTAKVWSVREVIAHEPSLAAFVNLAPGARLRRVSADSEWMKE